MMAWRRLWRTPLFTVAAVLSLTIGIGANTAIFTLANAILFRPITARAPQQLVRLAAMDGGGRPGAVLAPMVSLIRDEHVFDGICGFVAPSSTVEIRGRVGPTATHALTAECFSTLGIGAAAGRVLRPDDERAGAPHVVVLSNRFWQREYNGNPAAIGDVIDIEGTKYTIVGVATRGFDGLLVGYPAQLFFPLGNFEGGLAAEFPPPSLMPMEVIGRLPPGVSAAAIEALVRTRWQSWLDASVPSRLGPLQQDLYRHRRWQITSAATGVDYSLRSRFETPLRALLIVAALVFFATCINVANLQLARAADRSRERAVRVALGASPGDLVVDAAVESSILLGIGSVAGVMVAYWVDHALVAMFRASSNSFSITIVPDSRVLTFAMLLAVTAFVVFAIVPALHASRIDTAALASASRAVVGERSRLREAAVVAQVALTVVLLAAGSVFTAAVREFRAVAVGYDVDRLVAAQLSPLPGGYEAGFSPDAYYASLLERVRALPGVEAATLANTFPLTPYSASIRVGIAGDQTEVDAEEAFVRPDFFSTMGIALAAGATFPTASGIAERSAVISEATAKALFERADVVGRAIRVGPSPQTQAIRVSGVVRDAILTNLQRANTRLVYLNQSQFGPTVQEWPALIVRSPAARPVGFAALQFAVRQGAREYVNHIRTISDQRDAALSQEQLLASVSSACAAIGLLLVVVGVFGLLSYAVTQRRREIGIRVALGARGRQVCWLVVRRALNWFVIGAAVGLPIAISGGRYAATALFGRAIDTSQTIVTIVVALGMSVVAAVLIPALRAASVDPVEMLRGDN